MSQPWETLCVAVKRIIQYLQGTLSYGVVLKPSFQFLLTAFVDDDWGTFLDDRRSTMGVCVFLGGQSSDVVL